MKGRSVRLSSEDETLERTVFEGYGITGDTFAVNYRALIHFLHENLHKSTLPPPPKFAKPDCEHLSEIDTSKFHCVYERKNAPPSIKPDLHLIDCAHCKQQKETRLAKEKINIPETTPVILPPVAVQGDLPPTEEPAATRIQFADDEHLEPIEGWQKIINYSKTDGSKICPFEHNKQYRFVYRFFCVNCERNHPKKYSACLALRASVQSTANTQKVNFT